MSLRLVIVALAFASTSAGAQPQDPIRGDAHDVATMIARAQLAAVASEDPEDRQLRLELVAVQKLFRRALIDASEARDSGALQVLGAECGRLQPRVPLRVLATSGPASAGWRQVGSALAELCSKRDELAAAGAASTRKSIAESLIERINRTYDPTVATDAPTILLPTPARARQH